MRVKKLIPIIALFITNILGAQECIYYYPHVEGATLVYQHYDKKDKPTGKTEQKLVSFSTTDKGSVGEILSRMYDSKGELTGEAKLKMRCEGGLYYFDMMSYVNQQTMDAYEGMDVKVDASDAEFPSNMKVGDKLKDANIIITVNTGAFPIKLSISITDRQIEAIESVTTPAGTFEAFKMKQTTTASFGFKLVTESTEWYCKDVGMVKSISYKSGKPFSSSELISLTY